MVTSKCQAYVDKFIRDDIKEALANEDESGKIELGGISHGPKDQIISDAGNTQGGVIAGTSGTKLDPWEKGSRPGADQNVLDAEPGSGERVPEVKVPAGSKPVGGQQTAGDNGKEFSGDRGDELVSVPPGRDSDSDQTPMDAVNYDLSEAYKKADAKLAENKEERKLKGLRVGVREEPGATDKGKSRRKTDIPGRQEVTPAQEEVPAEETKRAKAKREAEEKTAQKKPHGETAVGEGADYSRKTPGYPISHNGPCDDSLGKPRWHFPPCPLRRRPTV